MPLTVTLAGETLCGPTDILSGWTPALLPQVQVVQLFRAPYATQYNRGNAQASYSFLVSRQHANYAAAAAYLSGLPAVIAPLIGAFSADLGLGGPPATLTNAVALFQARPAIGIRTWVQFTVTGAPA
jgi:hypothetical protein